MNARKYEARTSYTFRSPLARSTVALAALATSVAACLAPIEEPGIEDEVGRADDALLVQAQQHPMDADVFEDYLDAQLLPLVKGYAASAGRDGTIWATAQGGVARNPGGGGGFQLMRLMTADTPSNVGSVSKYFSGSALLYFMRQRDEQSLDAWLDTPFVDLLPPKWTKSVHSSLDDVSVRQLLQHKSGIRQSSEDPFTLLANGVNPNNVEVRSYNNLNYKLLTYIIPVVADPAYESYIEWASTFASSDSIRVFLGQLYHNVMMNDFLPALPYDIAPSCRPTTEYDDTYALTYASKTDTGTGRVWDSWVQETGCRAQGGWYFNTGDLTKLGMAMQNSNSVIDQSVRDQMWDWQNPDDRLVFSGFESGSWMSGAFGGVWRAPLHNGSHGWSGVRAESVIMLMPDRTVLSVVINSPVGTATLENMIENAYRASIGE